MSGLSGARIAQADGASCAIPLQRQGVPIGGRQRLQAALGVMT
ncbi:hypothetical protein [Castellaniella sp.]|nr:hypothetical protein [Castellaniella sp.]